MDVRSPAVRPPRPTTTTTPGGPKEEVRRFSRPLDFWRTPPPPPPCPHQLVLPLLRPPSSLHRRRPRFARGETEDLKRVGAEHVRGEGGGASAPMPHPLAISTRQSGKWDLTPTPPPNRLPPKPPQRPPPCSLKPISPRNSLQERELIPKCTKMCV